MVHPVQTRMELIHTAEIIHNNEDPSNDKHNHSEPSHLNMVRILIHIIKHGVFLHVLGDALGSLGVVLSSLLVMFGNHLFIIIRSRRLEKLHGPFNFYFNYFFNHVEHYSID